MKGKGSVQDFVLRASLLPATYAAKVFLISSGRAGKQRGFHVPFPVHAPDHQNLKVTVDLTGKGGACPIRIAANGDNSLDILIGGFR